MADPTKTGGDLSKDSDKTGDDLSKREKLKEKIKAPINEIREKLKDSSLYDVKVKAIHAKAQIGKFGNIVNPNHRHDEEHEQKTDEKRKKLREGHRYESFAPERDGNMVKWYVDGRDYFWAVSVALEAAKETIYIEDWWLSPELYLRRPPYDCKDWRLDRILKRKAEQGVKIYVVVYKEIEQALTCNSAHTKKALGSLCPEGSPGYGNIKVMRHPDHNFLENASDMTFYWAHHEKFIVIDYNIAFIGGLDLCFGRWDHHQHPLADVHPTGSQNEVFPGQDFNNNRIMDFHSVEDWKSNELSKAEYGRMPWHDIGMGLIGPCVVDIAEHFVLRWNFTKRDKYKRDERYDWLELETRSGDDEDLVGVQRPKHPVGGYTKHPLNPLNTKNLENRGSVHAQLVRSSADWSSGILPHEHSIQNAYCDLIRSAQHYVYIENQFFITATGDKQEPVQNQIGKAIVDAVVKAGKENRKFRVIIVLPAIPGFAGDLRQDAAKGTRAIMDYQYKSLVRGEHSIFERVKAEGVDPTQHIFVFNLRSYDRLNATPAMKRQEEESGVSYQEVQRAQAEEVMSSDLHGEHTKRSKNPLQKAPATTSDTSSSDDEDDEEERQRIRDRKKKFEEHRKDGEEVPSEDSIAKNAMLDQKNVSEEPWVEEEAMGGPANEADNIIQEELYIHAKLLIVDDKTVVCGSSNINDRSQLGNHDSELSIVVQDTKTIESTMDGQPYQAAHFAATLRRFLWREHLGLLPPQPLDAKDDPNAQPPSDSSPNETLPGEHDEFVADPLNEDVWKMWTTQATTNTEVFRDLFHADPDDFIITFDDYEKFLPKEREVDVSIPGKDGAEPTLEKKLIKLKQGHLWKVEAPIEEIKKDLDKIRGHLVWMPLRFLEKAEMAEEGLQVNKITESIYT